MNNEINLGDIVVFKTDGRAFEIIGKYIVPDDRLWRVEAIDENDPPIPDRNRKYRLAAVDCPNVILDNIPERYIESYSAKLEREFEEQRIEELKKMKGNEIKVGDKVRVSKDAPSLFADLDNVAWCNVESVVAKIEDDAAEIKSYVENDDYFVYLVIPTKYLVKVEEEKPKIKVGDKVRIKGYGVSATVVDIDSNYVYVRREDGITQEWPWHIVELAEPKQQTEENKHNFGEITIPVKVDLDDTYWDNYSAELAREVAVKIVNKNMDNHPYEVGAYAANVAKSVVENLKKK